MNWQGVFLVFSGLILMMLLALPLLRTPQTASKAQLEEAMAPCSGVPSATHPTS